ncbi:MAG: iron ABC transporter permease, partial [Oscillospiraceae bacterium]|nr:iron ABC transporter permease [Oscillospiraceae bacterium]
GLSAAGAAFQGVFSNPLATPDTLGVASGASFGAAFAMLTGSALLGTQAMALVCGCAACLLTMLIAGRERSSVSSVILGGMAVSSVFQALVALVKYVADPVDELPAITYWLMGSMSRASYRSLAVGLPFIAAGTLVIFFLRWRLDVISLSEDEAHSLGMNVRAMRTVYIVASSLITASCVSMCGQVGWIGLLVPHISRMIGGSSGRSVIPLSVSLGAVFMIIMDTLARTMTAAEIPISILTALIGAPMFIVLLRRSSQTKGGAA